MPRSLRDRKARDVVEDVTTRTVPLDDPGVDVDSLGKRLIARHRDEGGCDRQSAVSSV